MQSPKWGLSSTGARRAFWSPGFVFGARRAIYLESRNAYPTRYVKAAYARECRGNYFVLRDLWNPNRINRGGETIAVRAKVASILIFIRSGANLEPGGLNREYAEWVLIAHRKPDLKALDAEVEGLVARLKQTK